MVTRIDKARRVLIAFVYGLFLTGGIAAYLIPPGAFAQSGVAHWLYLAWIGCLTCGGLSSALGAAFRSPLAELAGIVLLETGWTAYVAVLIPRATRTAGVVLVVALVGAVVLLLARRFLEILQVAQVGRRTPR